MYTKPKCCKPQILNAYILNENVVVTNSKYLQNIIINLYALQKITICIAGKQIESIKDSGTEIPILNTTLAPDLKIERKGKALPSSAFCKTIEATLAIIPIY